VGNVWEWTSTVYRPYPYQGERPEDLGSREPRVLRGGAWGGAQEELRVSERVRLMPAGRLTDLGFRCARDVSPCPLSLPLEVWR